ncbi:MAG: DMT family transporter, partial [Eggerthellaceae bacterium]|nr:DMT family transporter [Eggerthellaceae bacterium]
VAQTTASETVQPFTFNFSRNFVGALFLCTVIGWRRRTGQDKPPTSDGEDGYSRRTLIIGGIACGVLLCAFSFLQQAGITSYPPEAAASGRSGFVTATYMVMVAVMGVFVGKRPHPLVFLSVLVALFGMYLLCVHDGLGNVYVGDWLTLACAFGCALHIIVIDQYTQVDGVRLSRVQLITAGTISLLGAIVFEQPTMAMILAAAIPILYAGICSDGIAYTLQIVAQQSTDPTVASIIMSLESVFAALGGWLILSESLTNVELFGCALVFVAVLMAQAPQLVSRDQ